MEGIDVLRIIWLFLIGIFLAGYSILDGFDLGVGILSPFIADEKDKRRLFNAIAPFWDGNEVWLITGGASLFAAFPNAYATVFSAFYIPLILVLLGLIFRAVSIEFWHQDEERKKLWEFAFFGGSLLPSLLFGVALGNVISGIPLNQKMDFIGNLFTLLKPYPLMIGLTGLFMIILQGSTYLILKTNGEIKEKACSAGFLAWKFFIIFFMLSFSLSFIYTPFAHKKTLPWIFSLISIILWFITGITIRRKSGLAFFFSSLLFLTLWAIAGSVQYPYLVRASNDPSLSLTIFNSSSSFLTLKVMLIIALIGMPLVVGYTLFVYKVFKGKFEN